MGPVSRPRAAFIAPVSRMRAILAARGNQSSSRSIADQIASTSAMTRVWGSAAAAQGWAAAPARPGAGGRARSPSMTSAQAAVSKSGRSGLRAQALGKAAAEQVVERPAGRAARSPASRPRSAASARAPPSVSPVRRPSRAKVWRVSAAGSGRRSARTPARSRSRVAERDQALAEAGEVPVQRLRLAGEGVEAGLVEIGGGEAGIEAVEEAPGAVVEALAGDVHVVGVEHAVHEAGGEPFRTEARRRRRRCGRRARRPGRDRPAASGQ